jgi:uncharacterized membrane protein
MRMKYRSGLRHILYELRGGFLLLPAAIMLAMAAVGLGVVWSEEHLPIVGALADRWWWTVSREPTIAQLVLSAIAGSVMTVLSVVYSVLLLVLTFASIQFSPRIIVAFMKDRVNQLTLGSFLGTAAFSLVTLPFIHTAPSPFVPRIAVSLAMLLAMASLVLLVYFIHNMALSIQPNSIVQRIALETEDVIERLSERSTAEQHPRHASVVAGTEGKALKCPASGYIQFVDRDTLRWTAKKHGVCVHVSRGIGQFIPKGSVLATVTPGDHASQACLRAALRAFHLGAVRTMEDDVEFGVLQIVDIALKAISPAVNDPSTAIMCVDYLSHILTCAATRKPPDEQIFDDAGVLRLILKQTSFARLLNIAFDQIAQYGRSDLAVSLRLLRALNDVAEVTRDHSNLLAIASTAQGICDLCAPHFSEAARAELVRRRDHVARITRVPFEVRCETRNGSRAQTQATPSRE